MYAVLNSCGKSNRPVPTLRAVRGYVYALPQGPGRDSGGRVCMEKTDPGEKAGDRANLQ